VLSLAMVLSVVLVLIFTDRTADAGDGFEATEGQRGSGEAPVEGGQTAPGTGASALVPEVTSDTTRLPAFDRTDPEESTADLDSEIKDWNQVFAGSVERSSFTDSDFESRQLFAGETKTHEVLLFELKKKWRDLGYPDSIVEDSATRMDDLRSEIEELLVQCARAGRETALAQLAYGGGEHLSKADRDAGTQFSAIDLDRVLAFQHLAYLPDGSARRVVVYVDESPGAEHWYSMAVERAEQYEASLYAMLGL